MRPVVEHVAFGEASWRYHIRREPAFAFSWHQHDEVELTLITRGGGHRHVGDHVDEYRPGDLVLVGSALPHTWRSAGSPQAAVQEAVVAQFGAALLGATEGAATAPAAEPPAALIGLPEFGPVRGLLHRARRGLALRADPRLIRRLTGMAELGAAARTVALLDVLVRLADMPAEPLASPGYRTPTRQDALPRLSAAMQYLADHYRDDIRLADVARTAHLSPAAFGRFFRRSTGRTLTDHLTDLRLGAARRLLVDTDRPVAAIAADCGFANLANFNRRFRARTGTSPREYRRARSPSAW